MAEPAVGEETRVIIGSLDRVALRVARAGNGLEVMEGRLLTAMEFPEASDAADVLAEAMLLAEVVREELDVALGELNQWR